MSHSPLGFSEAKRNGGIGDLCSMRFNTKRAAQFAAVALLVTAATAGVLTLVMGGSTHYLTHLRNTSLYSAPVGLLGIALAGLIGKKHATPSIKLPPGTTGMEWVGSTSPLA